MYNDGLSPADVAVLSGNNGGNGNNGFGNGDGAWWIIIFLIFATMGWGRNGFGGGNDGFRQRCEAVRHRNAAAPEKPPDGSDYSRCRLCVGSFQGKCGTPAVCGESPFS